MDYRTVTDTTSKQYAIISQSNIKEDGIIYYEDKYVLVALGSYYGDVGSKYKLTFENGKTIFVIKADQKSNAHVIDGCYHESNNSIVEFVVDTNKLQSIATKSGDVGLLSEFKGKIIKIEKEN